ncbi:reverse transcriptase domain-containing protein [Trichonephila clavipes]|uniref:Reverse transcriptase domain-containing protein n=1 Tax=Trichonephila clavipes TaxID=2585209 RepID=A0A8X6R8Z4_TRICX|nr:reverse transcriptase domain-containing protein [Trichonephila clavipes]
MQDNNWLYNEYKNIVKDQIKENIVEECSSHFETNSYYMPHSAVVRKDKETTKVRMVFDASSKEDYRETYELLNTSLYVDDLFAGSSESFYKAFDLSKDAIEILKDANMNLRKFKTNSKELRKLWNENGIGDVCESGERSLKVLGIIWNLNNDTFKLDAQPLLELIKNLKNSKRCVLKTAAKVFDPIGFISPFVLIIKCLMQEIWEYGLGWDEQLPTELKNKWETWCSQVCLLNDLTLER